jgi:heme/copper-type cytochrome/quinol oxidase subunit 2
MPRSKSAPNSTSGAHPTLSLGNEDSNAATNLQQLYPLSPPTKSVNKIHTFIIWSIFNLLFIPFGILCCYFSYKVNQFKEQNRYEVAKKWSKRTFVINIMTTLLMCGIIITVVMLHYDYHQRHSSQVNQTLTTIPYIPWQPGR